MPTSDRATSTEISASTAFRTRESTTRELAVSPLAAISLASTTEPTHSAASSVRTTETVPTSRSHSVSRCLPIGMAMASSASTRSDRRPVTCSATTSQITRAMARSKEPIQLERGNERRST